MCDRESVRGGRIFTSCLRDYWLHAGYIVVKIRQVRAV